MKKDVKKQLRLQVIILMFAMAVIILAGNVVDNIGYVMKGAAIVLGASAYGLFKRWDKRNLLPRLEDI